MHTRYAIIGVLSLALVGPSLAVAQDRERDRERRVEQAEEQLEEARQALERAIEQLRLQEDDALRSLELAIRQLRRAERELARGRLADEIRDIVVLPGDRRGNALVRVFSDDRARMGVILDSSEDPAVDSIGARLEAVTPGGPADEAGLRVGDIVTRVDGEILARTGRRGERPGEKLARLVRQHDEGDTLNIAYRRGNEGGNATVVLRRLGPSAYSIGWSGDSSRVWFDTDRLPQLGYDRIEVGPGVVAPGVEVGPLRIRLPRRWLDMELVTLDDELGSYFGTTEGLLVVRAPSESALNLRSGDVILNIDGRTPSSPSHALRIMRSYEPGESMRIEIMRDKRRMTVTATVPESE